MAIEPNNPPLPDSAWHDMSLADPHHGRVHYSQSRATLSVTNFWGNPGVSPYAANTPNDGIILDPSLCGNDFWNRQAMDFNQQILHAGPWGNQYIGSSFRGANMPAQGTNSFAEGIYYLDWPPISSPQYIPLPQVANEFGSDCADSSYLSFPLSSHYIPPPATGETEGEESSSRCGKRRRRASRSNTDRGENGDQSASQTQPSENEQRRSTRSKKVAPARLAQRLGPPEQTSAVTASARGKGAQLSQLGQKKAFYGDRMGDDHKPKAEVKVEKDEHGRRRLYGWVDNEWSMPL